MRAVPPTTLLVLFVATLAGCFGGGDAGLDPTPTASPSPTPSGGPHILPVPDPSVDGNATLGLVTVAQGFATPLLATHAGDGSDRLFVMEQRGRIWVVHDGAVSLYADLASRVTQQGGETGLLGLAFHPDFADNRAVVVSYTDAGGTSVLSRFFEADGVLDTTSEEVLLTVTQPFSNHNGGHVAYGPDGFLYYGLGDGGFAADPLLQGQNPATLLGALLRLDVGPDGPYTIPADNPFMGNPVLADEVWAYGLRNPWRFTFDRDTGDLWIADVGQDAWEEVNFLAAGTGAGTNFGWNLFEGSHQFPSGSPAPAPPGFTHPVAEYPNAGGDCSVTGGHVYRGDLVADLVGHYLFGDFCSGKIWSLAGPDAAMAPLLHPDVRISSFGEDEAGEVYVVDYVGGAVLRFALV